VRPGTLWPLDTVRQAAGNCWRVPAGEPRRNPPARPPTYRAHHDRSPAACPPCASRLHTFCRRTPLRQGLMQEQPCDCTAFASLDAC
jgi:hypothetical protein